MCGAFLFGIVIFHVTTDQTSDKPGGKERETRREREREREKESERTIREWNKKTL